VVNLHVGEITRRNALIRQLVDGQYQRNDVELRPGTFRVRGDTLEIIPAYEDKRGIRITDENGPVAGRYWPWDIDMVHASKYPGIMSSAYWYFSAYDAMCYERVRGRRARGGNCNSPPTIGEFLNDLPTQIVYQYEDQDGRPLAGAEVWVYQAKGDGLSWYGKVFDDEADIKTTTNAKGQAVFEGKTLFSADGTIEHTFGISQGVVIIRITHDGTHYLTFEECTDPNIAHNIGRTERAFFRRTITLRETAEPDPAAWDITNTWEPKQAPSGAAQTE
jgi:hypothetical protein